MEDSLAFEPNRAAVLSMDLQTGIVAIATHSNRRISRDRWGRPRCGRGWFGL